MRPAHVRRVWAAARPYKRVCGGKAEERTGDLRSKLRQRRPIRKLRGGLVAPDGSISGATAGTVTLDTRDRPGHAEI